MESILKIGETKFQEIVDEEYLDFLERMKIPVDVAPNNSLKENLYIMHVCFVNKIALFLTGAPGQSKTLSMNLILDQMGNNFKESQDCYLKTLPTVHPRIFQGYQQVTSEQIINQFKMALEH